MEEIGSGRVSVNDRSELIEIFNSFTRSVTYGGLPLVMLGTEGLGAFARIIGSGNIRVGVRAIETAFKGISKSDLRRAGFGIETEFDSSRIYGAFEEMESSYTRSKVLGAMHALEGGIRKWGGEQTLTRRMKMMHYVASSGILDQYRNKLDNILLLEDILDRSGDGQKRFIENARKAGIRKDHAELMIVNGVVTPGNVEAAKAFKAMDKNILGNIFEMRRRVQDLPENLREDGQKLVDALSDIGTSDAEAFVTTPSPNTMYRTDSALGNAFLMYTTFPLAFVQRTMNRAFAAPGHKAAGYLAMYLFGEMFSSTMRRIVYGDEELEDIINDWKENPLENAALVLARAPITGPWNMPAELAASAFTRVPGFSTGGAAGLSRPFSTIKNAIQVGKNLTTGEEDTGEISRLLSGLPITSSLYLRLPQRIFKQSEDDKQWEEHFFAPFEGRINQQDQPVVNQPPPQTEPVERTPQPPVNRRPRTHRCRISRSAGTDNYAESAIAAAAFGSGPSIEMSKHCL
jgi:hypothetical protein